MRRGALLLSLLGALACARKPTSTTTAAPADAGKSSRAQPGSTLDVDALTELRLRAEADAAGGIVIAPGSSKEHPLPTCGTTGSYIAVADVACADGSIALDGDIPRAMRSRRGNVGPNADRHIIDLYELACPEGTKRVYVDMYGCDAAKPSRSEAEIDRYIEEMFGANDFGGFIERCRAEEARGPDRISLMMQTCVPMMPTALREQGKVKEGNAWLAKYCAGTPPPTVEEPKRYKYLTSVLELVEILRVRQGKSAAEAARDRQAITAEYAKTCAVDPKIYETWLAAHPEG
jgi:hypothetical protein